MMTLTVASASRPARAAVGLARTLAADEADDLMRRTAQALRARSEALDDDLQALRVMLAVFVADAPRRPGRRLPPAERRSLAGRVAALPARERALLYLFFGVGLSLATVAEVMGLGAGDAAVTLTRLTEQLAEAEPGQLRLV